MVIKLVKGQFDSAEQDFLSFGGFEIKTFKYKSGVEALKVKNQRGHFVMLPFVGQQLWDVWFDGRKISMDTSIKEPCRTSVYLQNYGGFLYHCGISAFGVPQKDDNHPQHGEIPNMEYDEAYIKCGEDEKGKYIIMGGVLNYDLAFVRHYKFSPECKIYENGTVFYMTMTLENLRDYPMEYMYLCHINFKPIDGARLIYSAKRDSEHIKVHKIVPDGIGEEQASRLRKFMEKISENPSYNDEIGLPDECYDPEICFAIKYDGDENNRAYTMEYKEGEGSFYVSHPVDCLPVGVRWISRTKNEDAFGMVLPATSEHLGYNDSKRKGYIKTLGGREKITFRIDAGYLEENEAKVMAEKIKNILGD